MRLLHHYHLHPFPHTRIRPRLSNRSICLPPHPVPIHQTCRQTCRTYAKRSTKRTLDDLPQGALSLAPIPPDLPSAQVLPRYPTVIAQVRQNMDRFTSCVLLTRVGGFYELYFEHAEIYGPQLGLKVTSKKTAMGGVSMAGFPYFQLEKFLKILVMEMGRFVAIAEEYKVPGDEGGGEGGLKWDRRVERVVTPGTLIDERFVEEGENHYLLAVAQDGAGGTGLAWLDLGTGDFFTQTSAGGLELAGDVGRVGPKEVVVSADDNELHAMLSMADGGGVVFTVCDEKEEVVEWAEMVETKIPLATMDAMSVAEKKAGDRLLTYVKTRLPGLVLKLQPPVQRRNEDVMVIDANTMRGLEIKNTLRDGGTKGSLLQTVRRTVTKSGSRLLARWLTNPATSVAVIDNRLDLVECFLRQERLREKIITLLKRTYDSQRIVQKFSLGRGDADDLIALAKTIDATNAVHECLKDVTDSSVQALLKRLRIPLDLASQIESSIDEEGLMRQQRQEESEAAEIAEMAEEVVARQEGVIVEKKRGRKIAKKEDMEKFEAWVMQKRASPILEKLHDALEELMQEKDALEQRLREEFRTQSLTLRWTPSLGHICHIKGRDAISSHTNTVLSSARSLSSSRTTRSFQLPEWTKLGLMIDQARLRIRVEESNVFQSLRTAVVSHLIILRRNASVLDELDVASAFAVLASEQSLIRPKLNNSTAHRIIGGRHPTVEAGLREQSRSFVANDCFVGDPDRLWIITGPNMAGKSTFLRQNALISILAQTGSYVPASHAEIGIVDRIFSRVGSADNLYRDQSTFMVEMLETAQILRDATERSFVVMDEVGRGTTPRDGVAVAYAVVRYLLERNRCRGLFATHFHELPKMMIREGREGVQEWCTDVQELGDGDWAFNHRLRRGVCGESHALKVAMLAGMPQEVMKVAEGCLRGLREGSKEGRKEGE